MARAPNGNSDRLRLELIQQVLKLPGGALGQAIVPEESSPADRAPLATTAPRSQPLPGVKQWPHAPLHRLSEQGTYIVTGATLHKAHHFRGEERLDLLERKLLELSREYAWQLEAWAVFSNHYHFVGHTFQSPTRLKQFLAHLHAQTAREVNRQDCAEGREVWYNYWETQLTFERSYFARLNYVHQNAVKHNLVPVANQYRWCSAEWFERTCPPSQVKTIYSFKTDRVNIQDDFDPC